MGKSVILTKEQEEQIIYNYTVLKYGQKKSGAFIPVSDRIVKKVLLKHNIHIKTIQETNVNKYFVNHDFFKKQSGDMAYWIGMLASDGSVNKNENQIYIELQRDDKEILEKMNTTIENQRPITDYETSRGYKNSKLYFYSKEIKKDLAEYNIIPNKTYSEDYDFPYKLDKKFYADYIRGLFDGDGSVKITGYSPTFQIDVGNENIAKEICKFFNEFDIELKFSPLPKKNVTLHRVYGYGKDKLNKIYNVLYSTDSNLYMKRKKDKFETLIF